MDQSRLSLKKNNCNKSWILNSLLQMLCIFLKQGKNAFFNLIVNNNNNSSTASKNQASRRYLRRKLLLKSLKVSQNVSKMKNLFHGYLDAKSKTTWYNIGPLILTIKSQSQVFQIYKNLVLLLNCVFLLWTPLKDLKNFQKLFSGH